MVTNTWWCYFFIRLKTNQINFYTASPSRFYLGKHSGRQLSLQPQHGSADMNAFFFGAKRVAASNSGGSMDMLDDGAAASAKGVRKHIIQVSTFQMVILMLFNTKESWTYEVSRQFLCPRPVSVPLWRPSSLIIHSIQTIRSCLHWAAFYDLLKYLTKMIPPVLYFLYSSDCPVFPCIFFLILHLVLYFH